MLSIKIIEVEMRVDLLIFGQLPLENISSMKATVLRSGFKRLKLKSPII